MEKMAFAHQLSAERKSILNGVSKVVQRVSRSSLLPASTSPKFIQAWLLTFIALLPNQGSKYSFFRENSENMPLCLLNICQNTFLSIQFIQQIHMVSKRKCDISWKGDRITMYVVPQTKNILTKRGFVLTSIFLCGRPGWWDLLEFDISR